MGASVWLRKKSYLRFAYIRRDSQAVGNGRIGLKMTLILAFAISLASRGASAALTNVKRNTVCVSSSTLYLSWIKEVIMSALSTWITSGI